MCRLFRGSRPFKLSTYGLICLLGGGVDPMHSLFGGSKPSKLSTHGFMPLVVGSTPHSLVGLDPSNNQCMS